MGYPFRVANAKVKFCNYLGKRELPPGRRQDMGNQATGVGMVVVPKLDRSADFQISEKDEKPM